MKIGIFVVMAGRDAGGPATYDHNLVRMLARLDRTNDYVIYGFSPEAVSVFGIDEENFQYRLLRPASRLISMSVGLPMLLWRDRIDLLHATFTPPPFSPVPYVFTHHCFSTFSHPEFYDKTIIKRLNALIIRGLKRADKILCVSENVRDLTAEKFSISSDRMEVVYNGVGKEFKPQGDGVARRLVAKKYGLEDDYFLYVGKLDARKNIVRLLHAFDMYRKETRGQERLVLAGGKTQTADGIDETIVRLGLVDSVLQLGYTKHEDLPCLYDAAKVFLFPSLWEGFGLPVIEAMACGTPVLTSNISCLPEIAGGAALLVNPYRTEEIAAGLAELAGSPTLRAKLAMQGRERASEFSWERCGRETLAVYQDLSGGLEHAAY